MTAPAERAGEEAAREPPRWRSWLAFEERGIAAAAILFFLVGATSSPHFLTIDNLTGILQSLTFLGFLAIGVGLTLMAGEIDISVGSIFGLAAVVTALLLHRGAPLWLAIAGGLGTGAGGGFVNGAVAELIWRRSACTARSRSSSPAARPSGACRHCQASSTLSARARWAACPS
jgi:predicted ABC-type sugar transport system permease subunit